MSCETQISKYTHIVQALLTQNFNVYKSFDNAVKFILSSDLTPEVKKLTIHNFAYIYEQLDNIVKASPEVKTSYLDIENTDKVKEAVHLLNDTDLYIKAMEGIFKIKATSPVTVEDIQKGIDDLTTLKSINRATDLAGPEGILAKIKSYVENTAFEDLGMRNSFVQSSIDALISAINYFTESPVYNNGLITYVRSELSKLSKTSEYVPISAIKDLAEVSLNNMIVTLTNKEMLEGYQQDDKVFVFLPDGTVEEMDKRYIKSIKPALPTYSNDIGNGLSYFTNEQLDSSLEMRPSANGYAERNAFKSRLESMANPQGQVSIHAVRLGAADRRVERMQQLSKSDPNYVQLANRTHETYETESQISKLKSGPNEVILSVARPTSEDQDIAITGVLSETGDIFNIYSTDNYTFVYSNNKTVKVDFTNPDHRALVKQLAVRLVDNKKIELTDADLAKLADAQSKYNAFKKDVIETHGETLKLNPSVDISDIFYKHYSILPSSRTTKKQPTLAEQMEADDRYSRSLEIFKRNADGTYTPTGSKKIPFVYTKWNNNSASPFMLNSMLASDEVIFYAGSYYSHDEYARDVLKLNARELDKLAQATKGTENSTALVIKFDAKGKMTVDNLMRIKPMAEAEHFALFMINFGEAVTKSNPKERAEAVKDLNFNKYTFKSRSLSTVLGGGTLYFNITTEGSGFTPSISLKYTGSNPDMLNINDSRNSFSVPLPLGLISKMHDTFMGKNSDLLKQVQNENETLKVYDLSTKEGLESFYMALPVLASNNTLGAKGRSLMTKIAEANTVFAKGVATNYFNELRKRAEAEKAASTEEDTSGEKIVGNVLAVMQKMMSGLQVEAMLAESDGNGNFHPQVEFTNANSSSYKSAFMTGGNNFRLVSAPTVTQPVIVSKGSVLPYSGKPVVEPAPVNVTRSEKPTATQEVPTTQIKTEEAKTEPKAPVKVGNKTFTNKNNPFSLASTKEGVSASSEAEIQSAVSLIKSILPQFDINLEDMSDVVDLTAIDGNVLGMYKDKVLYLNEKLKVAGVLYHEAFHGVFRHLMKYENRRALLDAVIGNARNKSKFTEKALLEFGRKRNLQLSLSELRDLAAEEILADGFKEYLTKKTSTTKKSLLTKFFELLKKVLNMFSSSRKLIEQTYEDIATGHYKHVAIQSGMYDGKAAYELVEGINELSLDNPANPEDVSYKSKSLTVDQQNQMIYMVTRHILNDSRSVSFDEKFDAATKYIREEVYNVDAIASKWPGMDVTAFKAKYGNLYSQYQFMLGGRMFGMNINDINSTGLEENNNIVLENTITNSEGESIDNTMGQFSYNQVKQMVSEHMKNLNNDVLEDESASVSTVMGEMNGDNSELTGDENASDTNDEVSSDQYDKNFYEINILDSAPTQFRKFLSMIQRDVFDPELGCTVPHMIDANYMMPMLLTLSSDNVPADIVDNLYVRAEQMRDNGYITHADDVTAVYNAIKELPQGSHMRNMIIDTLHATQIGYLMFNVTSPTVYKTTAEEESNMLKDNKLKVTLQDRMTANTAREYKNGLVSSMILEYKKNNNPKNRAAYDEKMKDLRYLLSDITNTKNILGESNPSARLDEFTNELHKGLVSIGLSIPKSMLKLSIIGIEMQNNNRKDILSRLSEKQLTEYNLDSNYIQENLHLEKSFFVSLSSIIQGVLDTHESLEKLLDDKSSAQYIITFNNILRRSSTYMSKYDPTAPNTIIKNASGKNIYSFVKYTPLMTIAQSVRRNGLKATLENDPYFKRFLKDFIGNNPMLGGVMTGATDEQTKKVELFLKNMQTVLFGGVQQGNNKIVKEGQTFKDIETGSLAILNIMSFMDRQREFSTDISGGTTEIQTFMRSYGQLEASQTNFMVTGLYDQYVNDKGVVDKSKISNALLGVIKQEYERIRKEYANREENKRTHGTTDLATGEVVNNVINNYNGKLGEDRVSIDTDSNSLRAYTFGKLADFFNDKDDVKQSLIQSAKENKEFSENDLKSIQEALGTYAENMFKKHVDNLVRKGVVKVNTYRQAKTFGVSGKAETFFTQGAGGKVKTTEVFEIPLLPDTIKLGYTDKTSVVNQYGSPENATKLVNDDGDTIGSAIMPNMKGLLQDAFYNTWINSLVFNDIFDGDAAMNIKNAVDMVKRNKKWLASGSNMKEGYHTVAYLDTILGFIHPVHSTHGPYRSEQEIIADPKLTEEMRAEILEDFKKAVSGLKVKDPITGKVTFDWGNTMQKMFDGQSVSLLMHQMDMFDTLGRMSEDAKQILIAKHYRPLTEGEERTLEAMKIVLNPKKTVTAARTSYHKLSENLIDRNDVSVIKPSKMIDEIGNPVSMSTIYEELGKLWNLVYDNRKYYQEALIAGNQEDAKQHMSDIQNIMTLIHDYYEPIKHRQELHDMLNSMEYHQIDQIMDTEASKCATKLPLNHSAAQRDSKGYINLPVSSVKVENNFKYLQVETSGVHDTAKYSVQSKVLIPADIQSLAEIISNNMINETGERLSKEDEEKINAISEKLLGDYESSMYEVMNARFEYLKNIMRGVVNPETGELEDKGFNTGKIFNLIRESMLSQRAPSNVVKLFEVNPDGTTKYNPNLPEIRKALQYYFFSQYSKHVTDEKGAGGKSIHVSSVGYNVLEQNGNVITTEEYKKNPAAYQDALVRQLGVSVEEEMVDGQMIKHYYVECIIPMPRFASEQHKEVFKEHLMKMFGTRIPTEDKRSMVSLKVVDFVDSTNANAIIVPQFVHLLAGSDFDVDALYQRMKAVYADAAGTYHAYGNYNYYRSNQEGQFVEFINSIASRSEFSGLISAEMDKLREQDSILPTEDVSKLLEYIGFFDHADHHHRDMSLTELKQRHELVKDMLKDLKESAKEYNKDASEYLDAILRGEIDLGPAGAGLLEKLQSAHEVSKDIDQALRERNEISTDKRIAYAALKLQATVNVLSKYGIPTSLESFNEDGKWGGMVAEKFQNKNLDATLNILSNELVFDNLYINERSSVERFEDIMEAFGINMEDVATNMNHYTLDFALYAKEINEMNKDGIGITANLNKFLALCSWFNLELSNPIWSFNSTNTAGEFESQLKNKFGAINEEKVRTIALIGNILGMFADGAKKPIPAALQMNEINANTILSMVGIGLSPEFAIAFNFIPEVRKAVDTVKYSQKALQENVSANTVYLNNALKEQLLDLYGRQDFSGKTVLQSLQQKGVFTADNPSSYRVNPINKSNIVIDFAARQFANETGGLDAMMSNTLPLSQIGFNVKTKTSELTEDEQKAILLTYYYDQVSQSWDLLRSGSITNLFKRLNPDFNAFDKLKQNVDGLLSGDQTIFTPDSLNRLKLGYQVWNVLHSTLNDLDNQASKLFLERSDVMRPLMNSFKGMFMRPETMADVLVGTIGIQHVVNTLPGSIKSPNPEIQAMLDDLDSTIKNSFTTEYWFTHNLGDDLSKLQQKYPGNKFLEILREDRGSDVIKGVTVTGMEVDVPMRFIRTIGGYESSDQRVKDIHDDAAALMQNTDSRLFMRKLYFHELARTGAGYAKNSFMQFLPTELKKPLSDSIGEFVRIFTENSNDREGLLENLKSYLGPEATNEQVYDMFKNIALQMAYAASREVGNTKIKGVSPISYFIDKSGIEGSYTSGLLRNMEIVKNSKGNTDLMAMKESAIKLVAKTFGIDPSKAASAKAFTPNVKTLGDSFVLNMDAYQDVYNATEKAQLSIGYKLGLRYKSGTYTFPLIIRVEGGTYILSGTDKASSSDLGKNIFNAITYTEADYTKMLMEGEDIQLGIPLSGSKAKYELIPTEYVNSNLNPVGFSKEQADVYKNLMQRKTKIELSKNKALIATGEKRIADEDIATFNALVKTLKRLPQEFSTRESRFTEFYNPTTGYREKAPQSSIWFKNENDLYDLVDKEEGEVYISNVNLSTGRQYKIATPEEIAAAKMNVASETTPATIEIFDGITASKMAAKEGKGIYAMTVNPGEKIPGLTEKTHFGNPWSVGNKNKEFSTDTNEEAVANYRSWLKGEEFTEVEPERRNWIVGIINSGRLDNKKFIYFKSGIYSHADALVEMINTRDKEAVQPTAPSGNKVDVTKVAPTLDLFMVTKTLPGGVTLKYYTKDSQTAAKFGDEAVKVKFNTANVLDRKSDLFKQLVTEYNNATGAKVDISPGKLEQQYGLFEYLKGRGFTSITAGSAIVEFGASSVKKIETEVKANPDEYTNHSGGAVGADSKFDEIGKEFGQLNHQHYYYGSKTPLGNVLLTDSQLQEGIEEMKKAAKILNRFPAKKDTINLLARNWFQVKNSTQIIAIAPIDSSMKFVEGGTGWAVAMGQANNKEINVFNLKDNNWYKWNGTTFVKSSVPVLAKNFAGIGSRQNYGVMTPQSIQAIRDVYENTFGTSAKSSTESTTEAPDSTDALAAMMKNMEKIMTDNLDLSDPKTVDYLYNLSSKTRTKENFQMEAQKLVVNLRSNNANISNEEILDNIKNCF
jgi:hypothetical protein